MDIVLGFDFANPPNVVIPRIPHASSPMRMQRSWPSDEDLGFHRLSREEMELLEPKADGGVPVDLGADENNAIFVNARAVGLPPRESQWQMAALLLRQNLLAVWDVGCGKTLLAALAAQLLLRDDVNVTKVIVIVPKSLTQNFRDTLLTLGMNDDEIDNDFDITTAAKFHKQFENMLSTDERARNRAKRALDAKMFGAFLIIDEAHEFRTALFPAKGEGLRSFIMVEAAHRCVRVLALTATPLVNRPFELSNLMAIVRQERFPLVRYAFEFLQSNNKYPGKYSNGEREGHLANYAGGLISFVEQNKDDFPAVTEERVVILLTEEQQRHMHKVELLDENAMRKSRLNGFSSNFHSGTRTISNKSGTENAVAVESSKAMKVVALLKERPGPAIVYSEFLSAGQHMAKAVLEGEGITTSLFNGTLSEEERLRAKEEFDSGNSQVLLISKAGNLGLDFKGVQTVICMEPGWNRAVMRQAIGRAVRYRSHTHLPVDKRNVKVFHLIVQKNEELADELRASAKTGDGILAYLAKKKEPVITAFLDDLRKISVELQPKDTDAGVKIERK